MYLEGQHPKCSLPKERYGRTIKFFSWEAGLTKYAGTQDTQQFTGFQGVDSRDNVFSRITKLSTLKKFEAQIILFLKPRSATIMKFG